VQRTRLQPPEASIRTHDGPWTRCTGVGFRLDHFA
jgi:hypothetical protein